MLMCANLHTNVDSHDVVVGRLKNANNHTENSLNLSLETNSPLRKRKKEREHSSVLQLLWIESPPSLKCPFRLIIRIARQRWKRFRFRIKLLAQQKSGRTAAGHNRNQTTGQCSCIGSTATRSAWVLLFARRPRGGQPDLTQVR